MTSLMLLLAVFWCLYRAGRQLASQAGVGQPRPAPWFLCLRPREVPGALLCLVLGGRQRRVLLEILRARAEARCPPYLPVPSRPLPLPVRTAVRSYPVRSPEELAAARRAVTGGLEPGMAGAEAWRTRPFRPEELKPGVHQVKSWDIRSGTVTYRWAVDHQGRCLCADCKRLRARHPVTAAPVSQDGSFTSMTDQMAAMDNLAEAIRRAQGIPPPDTGWVTGDVGPDPAPRELDRRRLYRTIGRLDREG